MVKKDSGRHKGTLLGTRRLEYKGDKQEFSHYGLKVMNFLHSYRGVLALVYGGIVAREAHALLPVNLVVGGPPASSI